MLIREYDQKKDLIIIIFKFMRNFNKSLAMGLLLALLFMGFGPIPVFSATTPTLGMAATYGVLASTYTNTVIGTTISGGVGFTTGPAVVPGGAHINYGSGAPYASAGADQGIALADLALQPCTFDFAPGAINLSTDITHGPAGVYTPGVYCSVGAMNVGGPLTLNGNGTYIFRSVGALTSTAGSIITLTGASACDVFWTPTEAATLAANTTFAGTIISDAGITIGANTIWSGRALAFGGTVTTDTDTITAPSCASSLATLHIIKQVINNNGGVATAALFNLHVKLAGVDVAGSPAVGTVTPGTSYSLAAGTYKVSEDVNASYTSSFSGDCDAGGNITLVAGNDKSCTITNDDIAALTGTINVVKVVVNDNGRTKTIANFPLFVNGVAVISGVTNTFAAPATYTVTETVNTDYVQSFSGDCDVNGQVILAVGTNKFCIITNNDTAPSSGGSGGTFFGPAAPPLIAVLKVPSPLSLPLGPGLVMYTYTLRNIGTVPVTDITMVGDTCSPIVLNSGDGNADSKLDVSETWEYRCSTTLTKTHTNTVVATGWANGLSATDIASATVVVGAPIVPPLIHVTKVPSTPTVLAGGTVTYTEKITNPGTVALNNVILTDDKRAPTKYVSGDTDNDAKLDTTETWTYTCRTSLNKTTTNTAVASGEANGLTARDFAVATVVVAAVVPGLPNTGSAPAENSILWFAGIAGIFVVLFFLYVRQKKQSE